jgi:hypothetical protein
MLLRVIFKLKLFLICNEDFKMSKKIISVTTRGIRESIVGDARDLPSSVEFRKSGLESSEPSFVGVSGTIVTASIDSKYLLAATGSTIALPRDVPAGTEIFISDYTLGSGASPITIVVDGSGSLPYGISGQESFELGEAATTAHLLKVDEGSVEISGQLATSSWIILIGYSS